MKTSQPSAECLSTSCFLNSLLREWPGWELGVTPNPLQAQSGCSQSIRIALQQHPEFALIWIPVRRFSLVGRHRYQMPFYLEDRRGHVEALGLMQMAAIILGEESIVGTTESAQRQVFLQRLQDSWVMTEESLQVREPCLQAAWDSELSFREAEQLLMVGHSFHPTPKSRDEFSEFDRKIYSPEMGGHFSLSWVLVEPQYFHECRSLHFKHDWIQELVMSDPSLQLLIPEGFQVLPMHPWQAEKLKQHPALQQAIAKGSIQFIAPSGDDWYPTSSLRSLYREQAPYMLKFSLSLKLTNSVRHLLVHEVERGVQVYDVMRSEQGRALLQGQPTLHILGEPAYAMLIGDDGSFLHESIVVCRENPVQTREDPQPLVLATLTQEDPLGRGNLILRHVMALAERLHIPLADATRQWFQKFCQMAVEPLMEAQSNFGILLGAHQQNMLISLHDDLPDRLYFRDCQGTGYSGWAYERMRDQVPSLDLENGNIVSHEMAAYLFTYYLVINSTFNVIAALADSEAIDERDLLMEFRNFVKTLVDRQPFDNELLLGLLHDETLMHKGNFHCSVQSINENTSKNPLAIYTPIPNPLRFTQV